MTPADKCRSEGWTVGTRLVGDEGHGPTVIEITAVGGESILARVVSLNGEPVQDREGMGTLSARDWQKHEDAS